MTATRAWVLLKSGRTVNLLDPEPDSWDDSDLAIGLSRTYRWGGHSCWDLPLSVAQHSLLVLALREQMQEHPLTRAQALRELLHDAPEGLLGFDPINPLKPHLGPEYAALDARLQTAINARYQLPAWTDEDHDLHKKADRLAAASEAFHMVGWSPEAIRDQLLIPIQSIEFDPLTRPAHTKPWEPWPARTAAARFLHKLQDLLAPDPEVEPSPEQVAVTKRE